MAGQICEDLETVGLNNDRIVAKLDQEPAIVDIAREIARIRSDDHGIAIDNSALGGSNGDGRIEEAIQDVEGVCRALRSNSDLRRR